MDSRALALTIARQIVAHRNKLAGKAPDAQKVHDVLDQVGKTINEHHDVHKKAISNIDEHWQGHGAESFTTRAQKVSKSLEATSTASTKGATIVAATAASLTTGHDRIAALVEEFVGKATPLLDSAQQASASGAKATQVRAVSQIAELLRPYANESTKILRKVQHDMGEATKQLKALEKHVEHDGFADPKVAHKASPGGKKTQDPKAPGGSQETKASGKGGSIVKNARKELGVGEHPPGSNNQKYGPSTYWCSLYTTWVWRKSGVKIPQYAFTGDVYKWGQRNHTAFDKNHLKDAKPGDVLLFGSGPENANTSKHIAIVESVEGNTVHTIEGNSGNQVQRQTHTLSSSTFYGGVHPK